MASARPRLQRLDVRVQRLNVGAQLPGVFDVTVVIAGVPLEYPMLAQKRLLFSDQTFVLNVQRISHRCR
jgi:hypothetical protein